jgi:hypothetical protein
MNLFNYFYVHDRSWRCGFKREPKASGSCDGVTRVLRPLAESGSSSGQTWLPRFGAAATVLISGEGEGVRFAVVQTGSPALNS